MTETFSNDDINSMINDISTNDQGESLGHDDVLDLVQKNFSKDPKTFFNEETEQSNVDDQISNKNYNIKIFDFKGPDKFSKDQLRSIRVIHENFSRSTANFLSGYLRKSVSINLSSVDQITYEQFVKAVSNPSTIAIIDMYPLSNSILLELSPTITFVIIDRIFGGEGDIFKHMRELSDIELSVINSLLVRLLSGLRESWSSIMDIRPRLEKIESDIQFIQIVPYNDIVILVNFDVQIGEIDGSMMFCIPYLSLDLVMGKLSAKSIYGTYKQDRTEDKENVFRHVMNLPLDIAVSMGKVKMNLDEIMGLNEGDYLSLDRKKDSYFDILVGNDTKFKGTVGKKDKKMVSKILSIKKEISKNKQMNSFDMDNIGE